MIATPNNMKKNIIWLYEGFVERLLFDSKYDGYANNERQAFRMFINEIQDGIHCNPKAKDDVLDNIVMIHDKYQDFCALQGAGCGKCRYKNVKGGKGACFEPFVMEQITIHTAISRVGDALLNISVFAGALFLIYIVLTAIGNVM